VSPWLKISIGLLLFLMGLGYLYQPRLMERMNAVIREYLLNDSYIALERRKWGICFLLLSFLFLYMGYTALYGPR